MKCYVTADELLKEETITGSMTDGGEMKIIKVYADISGQEILGMGGAVTEAAAYTYAQMSENKKRELLSRYFGEAGNRYNFCRVPIQSCDFSLGNYSYIEDANDRELHTFSIERDKKYIIPLLLDAIKMNPDIQFLASPWSPPGFMKTNGEMNRGGKLKEEYRQMWADMICRYIREYRKEGIRITRITVQNEPAAVQSWDSCIYSAGEEAEFAARYLAPALEREGLAEVKINIWDHNKEKVLDRAQESFAVEGADKAVSGVAFHWYTGDHFEALAELRRRYPDKELIFTEGCVEYSRFANEDQISHAEMYAHDIIGDFNAGANAFIDWNIYLDEKGGPNHVGNYCDAPIMCDTKKDEVDVKRSYYYIGHFSRFVKPGARRILVSKYTKDLETAGFINPDGEKVVVVMNATDRDQSFTLSDGKESYGIEMRRHSIATFCW